MKVGITDGAGNVWVDDVPVPKPNDYQCLCRICIGFIPIGCRS